MKHKSFALLVGALVLLGPMTVFAQGTKRVSIVLPKRGVVSLTLPSEWTVRQETQGPAVLVKIGPARSGEDFGAVMAVFEVPADTAVSDPAMLKRMLVEQGKKLLPEPVQKEIVFTPMPTAYGTGYIFHVTDPNPEKGPGDYREAHQGAALLGRVLLTVTILTHTKDTTTVPRMMDVVRNAKVN